MKYVVIQTGGKQYRASEGDILEVESLPVEKGLEYTFAEVLLYANEGVTKIGFPLVAGVSVKGLILDHVKGKKIRVAKFKAKARYRKVIGHRQHVSRVKVESITDGEKPAVEKKVVKQTAKSVEKVV